MFFISKDFLTLVSVRISASSEITLSFAVLCGGVFSRLVTRSLVTDAFWVKLGVSKTANSIDFATVLVKSVVSDNHIYVI